MAYRCSTTSGENRVQPAWFELTSPDAVFASQSDHYRLSMRQAVAPYLLFNFASYSEDDGCAEYNENCNVVKALENETFSAQTSLAGVREASLNKIELVHVNPIARLVSLTAEATEDGGLPVKGKVSWKVDLGFGPDIEPGKEAIEQPQLDQVTEPGVVPGPDEICSGGEYYPVDGGIPRRSIPTRRPISRRPISRRPIPRRRNACAWNPAIGISGHAKPRLSATW